MKAKSMLTFTGKIAGLTVVMIICFILAAMLSGIADPGADQAQVPEGPVSQMNALLITALLETIVLSWIIVQSRWTGLKLTGAVILAFYGSMTFTAQLESLVYLPDKMPAGMIPKLFIMGLILAILFTPAAVFVLGKMKKNIAESQGKEQKHALWKQWIIRVAGLVLIYLILYYGFGYYVAWKNPAVRAFYGGSDPGNIFAQLASIAQSTPWMFPFQALRALIWILMLIPVTQMLKGNSWQTALMMAAFVSVWSVQLITPNPYMPPEVASAHLVETLSSNFIFGWIVGWLLNRRYLTA